MHRPILLNDLLGPLVHIVNFFDGLKLDFEHVDVGLGQEFLGAEGQKVRDGERTIDVGLLNALEYAL